MTIINLTQHVPTPEQTTLDRETFNRVWDEAFLSGVRASQVMAPGHAVPVDHILRDQAWTRELRKGLTNAGAHPTRYSTRSEDL